MPLLQDHIAVVTGAGSGIGRAIALGYAREGARVVLLDMNEKSAADAAREIRDAGGKARGFVIVGRGRRPYPLDLELPFPELYIHDATPGPINTMHRQKLSVSAPVNLN